MSKKLPERSAPLNLCAARTHGLCCCLLQPYCSYGWGDKVGRCSSSKDWVITFRKASACQAAISVSAGFLPMEELPGDQSPFPCSPGLPAMQRGEKAWRRNPASYRCLGKLITDGLLPTFHCSVCPQGLQATLHDRNQALSSMVFAWRITLPEISMLWRSVLIRTKCHSIWITICRRTECLFC